MFFLLTLTAPSFGRVHRGPNTAKGQTSVNRRCDCGMWHTVEEANLRIIIRT